MSIIIKGMKMPTSPVLFCIHPDGKVLADLEGGWREYKAVPVPPHGRLIDENDVMKSAEELRKSPWYNDEPYHAMRKDGFEMAIDMAVKDAPTVIEAEVTE